MTVARNASQLGLSPAPPALAEAWLDRVDAVSRAALGVADLKGDQLAEALARVSFAYTRERASLEVLQGDDDVLCARLKFFLPRDLLKLHGPLAELQRANALPGRSSWRVLDLGAGLGTSSLGIARFAALTGCATRLDVTAIDIDAEALALFEQLAEDVVQLPGVPIALRTITADLAGSLTGLEAHVAPPYDVILLGLALNELRSDAENITAQLAAERLTQLARWLAPDGVLLVIEPALRETSRFLHAVRDVLASRQRAPYVFAPCVRSAACPMLARPRDYCHERVPFRLAPRLAQLAKKAGLRDADLTYSYLTLHAAARSLRELHARRTGQPTSVYRAVSAVLPSKGKLELWLCGETAAPRAMRLDRHQSELNASIERAGRGTLLELDVQMDPSSERVRVDPETRITLLHGWTHGT